jgi:large subunit ribosomal protein L31e
MSGSSPKERIYTIPLRDAWKAPWTDRAPTAIKIVKKFVERHLKVGAKGEGRIRISEELNRIIWSRGREKPPRRVKVRIVKEEDVCTVYPAEGV